MYVTEVPTVTSSFFFNDTATTEIYTLSLHDALPISWPQSSRPPARRHYAIVRPRPKRLRMTPAPAAARFRQNINPSLRGRSHAGNRDRTSRPEPGRRTGLSVHALAALGLFLCLHQARRGDDPAGDIHRGAHGDCRRTASFYLAVPWSWLAPRGPVLAPLLRPGPAQQRRSLHSHRLGGVPRRFRPGGDPEFDDADLHLPAWGTPCASGEADAAPALRRHHRTCRRRPHHRDAGLWRLGRCGDSTARHRDGNDLLCGRGLVRAPVPWPRPHDAGGGIPHRWYPAADPAQPHHRSAVEFVAIGGFARRTPGPCGLFHSPRARHLLPAHREPGIAGNHGPGLSAGSRRRCHRPHLPRREPGPRGSDLPDPRGDWRPRHDPPPTNLVERRPGERTGPLFMVHRPPAPAAMPWRAGRSHPARYRPRSPRGRARIRQAILAAVMQSAS